MRLRILGPVEVLAGGARVPIDRPRRRAALAFLLFSANRLVPTEALIDALWGGAAPSTARAQVQAELSAIRRTLRDAGLAWSPVSRPSGYLAQLETEQLDYLEFVDLVARARAAPAPESAARLLREALAQWGGTAFADVNAAYIHSARAHLDEQRLGAYEQLADVELGLGRHFELAAELRAVLDAHPLRERLRGQLMLALHRSGRRAEALALARDLRQLLAEQQGLDPGRAVLLLEQQILRADASLEPVGPQVRHLPEQLHVSGPAPAPAQAPEPAPAEPGVPAPAQLPAGVPNFTGRAAHLSLLDRFAAADGAGTPLATVVSGTAGVGKSALTIHWAHRAAPRFPDGQLYVNLRGYGPGTPLAPMDVLARFLRALGVAPEHVPADEDEAATIYRTRLAGRRVLVLLDNAHSPEQVRPLLPGDPTCRVVITSRDRLPGLVARDGAQPMPLDRLTPDESHTLLAGILTAPRVRAEPAAATELARLCADLPLALRIAATDLAAQPDRDIAGYVAALRAGNRLAALAAEGDAQAAVRVAFDQSYAVLAPAAQRVFCLLGLVPGPDFTAGVTAALAGVDVATADAILTRLLRAHVVEQRSPGRFVLHDLLRLYAAERGEAEMTTADRAAATARLHEYTLSTVETAGDLLHPQVVRLPRPAPDTAQGESFADDTRALAWLEAERHNLGALIAHTAEHGPRPVAWRLADALRGFFQLCMYPVDWAAAAQTALAAAEADAAPAGQAAAHISLASLRWRQSMVPEAIDHLQRAVALSREAEWPEGQAAALGNLAIIDGELGWAERAVEAHTLALALCLQLGLRATAAGNLDNLGSAMLTLGRLAEATQSLEQGVALSREIKAPVVEANTLQTLGDARMALGDFDGALAVLADALALHRELADRVGVALTLCSLATLHLQLGGTDQAGQELELAVTLTRELGQSRLETRAFNVVGAYRRARGEAGAAIAAHLAALRAAEKTRARYLEADALVGLAAAHRLAGEYGAAREHGERALAVARKFRFAVIEGRALTGLAATQLLRGDAIAAADLAQEARERHRACGHRLGEARALLVLSQAVAQVKGVDAAAAYRVETRDLFAALGVPQPAESALADE